MKSAITTLPMLLATAGMLGGCAAALSGLGSSESLSCKAPEGVVCSAVSGVYANAAALAAKRAPLATAPVPALFSAITVAPGPDQPPMPSRTVVRSSPRVLRLWIAPWEDGDGDLHEASTVHVLVDHGRWSIDHVRATPGSRLDAVTPPLPGTRDNTPPQPAAETPPRSEMLPVPPGRQPMLNALPR